MSGKKVTILQLNDSHGYFEIHPELFWEGSVEKYRQVGGYARISTLFNKIRDDHPNEVVTLDNGDTIHGTFPAINSKGEDVVPILNHLSFDGMTAHWEFAYGPIQFDKIVKKLRYPMLAINCYRKNGRELAYKPYHIIERNDLQIGIIGIAATIVDKTMPDHFSEGLYFTLGRDELQKYVKQLRESERVDLIIVLSHLGYPQELKLAEEVDGIDVLLSGHTHNRIYEAVISNGAIVIQSGCHGSFIGRLDIEVSEKRVKDFKHQLITVDASIDPDESALDIIERSLSPLRDKLRTVVGQTMTALNRSRVLESTMDNLLLKAVRETTGTQLAFSNGWRYGAPIPPGQMTMNDLWNIVPTNPPISICKITGEDLWKMMEENLEHTFSSDPYKQMGGYVKRCLGLNMYFKVENPEFRRIQDFYVNGKKLEKNKTYSACFLTSQGIPSKYGHDRSNLDINAIEALMEYLKKNGPIISEYEESVVPI
jgi:2',3'-cyclic-nucleotide 2'-phosphodiesterase (5'-nucleotidase family)